MLKKFSRHNTKVFSSSFTGNVEVFKFEDYDNLFSRALAMQSFPVLGIRTPYQAECGVLSVVYRTSALPQPPVSKRKLAPHFCFFELVKGSGR